LRDIVKKHPIITYYVALLICKVTLSHVCLCMYELNGHARRITFGVCKMPNDFRHNILFLKE